MEYKEIDCLIAEKIMGWQVIHYENIDTTVIDDGEFPFEAEEFKPTKSIECAWEVVKKIQEKEKLNFELQRRGADGSCFVSFISYGTSNEPHKTFWDAAKSAPLAICKAALKTVGALEES